LADGGGAVAAPTATAKSADKFVFISPSFYLEASVFKKENDLTWFIYLP